MKRVGKILEAVGLCLAMILTMGATFGTEKVQAAGTYSIRINRATNVVTVYDGSGQPIKAMTCSTGGANTPLGTFSTGGKYRWWELDGPCWGQYCTRITGHILFHSVWYYAKNDPATQSTVQYNRLGTPASHGCVRLTVGDCKWIYDNCPTGMKVTIFDGTSADDPLGKPATMHVSEASRMGWDPTDPTEGNPYATAMPSIDVSKVKTKISYGSDWDGLTSGVVALDSCGNDVTLDLTVKTKLKTKKLGTYKVTYNLTDGLGRKAKESVKIKVVDTKKASITGYKKKVTVTLGTEIMNLKSGVKATNVTGKNLTKKIKVTVTSPSGAVSKNHKGSYTFNELGTYTVTYEVKNPNNDKVTTKVAYVTVQ